MPKILNWPESVDNYAVYIMTRTCFHPCKIGVSNAVEKRLKSIQTCHWDKLIVDYVYWFQNSSDAFKAERRCHKLLADKRLVGEWFDVKPWEAATVLNDVIKAMGYDLSDYREKSDGALIKALDAFLV